MGRADQSAPADELVAQKPPGVETVGDDAGLRGLRIADFEAEHDCRQQQRQGQITAKNRAIAALPGEVEEKGQEGGGRDME